MNTRVITTRIARKYPMDGIRLSALSTQPAMDAIHKRFRFNSHSIATPMPTFDPMEQTFPPGIVFDIGTGVTEEKNVFSLRFLHITRQLIVADVAATTDEAELIMQQLDEVLAGFPSFDEKPLLGTPEEILHYSEVICNASTSLLHLFKPQFTDIMASLLHPNQEMTISPTLNFQLEPSHQPSAGSISSSSSRTVQLSYRAGTRPDELVIFSAAPLPSDQHVAYVEQLLMILNEQ
jgi:hypothetical protein